MILLLRKTKGEERISMGLFSKKGLCPVCGGEVKGLFLTKIGDKKTLCKGCSKQISMNKGLLKTATPAFIQEHLAYRKKNAEKYAALRWDVEYTDVPGLRFGVDAGAGFFIWCMTICMMRIIHWCFPLTS